MARLGLFDQDPIGLGERDAYQGVKRNHLEEARIHQVFSGIPSDQGEPGNSGQGCDRPEHDALGGCCKENRDGEVEEERAARATGERDGKQ